MKLSRYILHLLLLAISYQSLVSCNKTLDVPSERFSPEENHWRTIQDSRAGLLGIYSLMRTATTANNAHWMYGDLRQGDFTSFNRKDLEAIIHGNLNSSFDLLQRLSDWRRFYAVINAANLFLEKVPQVLESDRLYTEENMILDRAQARVLRAFAYYYAMRIWGDVPLIIRSHDNGSFPQIETTDQRVVLDFLIQDIESVLDQLPYRYGVSPVSYYGYFDAQRWTGVLMNKVSAYALLAHMSALKEDYLSVERYTRLLFNDYSKLANGIDYLSTGTLTAAGQNSFFSGTRVGHLIGFGFSYDFGEATTDGHIESLTLASPIISKTSPDIYVDKDAINMIFDEPGDVRYGVDTLTGELRTAYFVNVNGETPVFSKIKALVVDDGTYAKYSSAMVFTRLEEMALLRAEALAVLKRGDDAVAMLNNIRSRRGLRLYNGPGKTDDEILDAIFGERRRELMGEGWRWYDLVRYHKIKKDDAAFNDLIANGGIYWPIAQSVLDNNKSLKQNPYWD
ncbi:RagB/SusD family nutrient uptake outer membrane protein [Sphingobacterium sp. SGG-5]|uniref:RagB/SusD family nutrient uptake outer membrane protein n=1 Tax=Sphingobacterium sp. SGG-5 TaxID=2710881 RepID=UPI0013EBCD27|nr:RagB/SusD family nutrient uptake outer membrane protein [Sphingobacterium sp. SGG-5]NGM62507.1 RagB/SusD family nutrient uptake outer membrane protein [Sphingobacterium sp. SGG-5]